ncbi:low molecular weight protein-tyrosine-phosphatase [Novilysobacter erysipheiresistens]|uniref:protein-tyrosine-phosphatase n=1 Tax=Novilysobacter erysipheiresistens TaxID=1749332 RepID=A0ABU7Z1S3_9GAMM
MRPAPARPRRILLVCVGNVCRSPTAEVLLRRRCRGHGIVVESAGLGALVGNPIEPLAEAVLADHGLSATSHVARQLTAGMVEAADLVLVMEASQRRAIAALSAPAAERTFLLGKWHGEVDIPDPYRQRLAVFRDVYWMIDKSVNSWCMHLF